MPHIHKIFHVLSYSYLKLIVAKSTMRCHVRRLLDTKLRSEEVTVFLSP